MNFIRGSWSDLEGRVVIFSIFSGNPADYYENGYDLIVGGVYANYLGNDESIFKTVKGFSDFEMEEYKNGIINAFQQQTSTTVDRKFIKYILAFEAPSEEDLLCMIPENYDLIHAGHFSDPELCVAAVQSVLDFYKIALKEQETNGLRMSFINYSDIRKGELVNYIKQAFVSPMIKAAEKDDAELLHRIGDRFIHFGEETPFSNDIYNLCSTISLGRKTDHTLIKAYILKMSSLHEENYELAAKLRDEIIELRKKFGYSS